MQKAATPSLHFRSYSASTSCLVGGSSSLAGVSIDFPTEDCSFTLAEAAAGIEIPYDVVIDSAVSGVSSDAQDAGGCDQPGPSGMRDFAQLGGSGQNYCLCDTGFCPPPVPSTTTLVPGVYGSVFSWEGRNWNGPSDTVNPQGAPFPAGTYTLTISIEGSVEDSSSTNPPYTVVGTLEIVLTP